MRNQVKVRGQQLVVLSTVIGLCLIAMPAEAHASPIDTGHLKQLEADDLAEGVSNQPILVFDGSGVRTVARSVVRAHANEDADIVYGDTYRALSRPNPASIHKTFHDGSAFSATSPEVVQSDTALALSEQGGTVHSGTTVFGAPLPSQIFGTDGRYRLQNVTSYSTNSFVQMEAPSGDNPNLNKLCSGVVYGANTIVTAGHCLLNDSGTWNWPWKITVDEIITIIPTEPVLARCHISTPGPQMGLPGTTTQCSRWTVPFLGHMERVGSP